MSRVRDVHLHTGDAAPDFPPLVPDPDDVRARARDVRSQYEPLMDALAKLAYAKDPDAAVALMRAVLRGTVSLCYAAEGTAVALGLPFDDTHEAVYRAALRGGQVDMEQLLPNIIDADHEEVTSHES